MVAIKAFLALATLASTIIASPFADAAPDASVVNERKWYPGRKCLNPSIAAGLVSGFGELLTAFTVAEAESVLAPDFTDTSDSINFLIGAPPGSVTFPSLQAFIAGQGAQPPIGFIVLEISAVTCTVVAFRWEAILGSGAPVKGINIFTARQSGNSTLGVDGWQIETNYSEFNSALWDVEIGGNCTAPHFG